MDTTHNTHLPYYASPPPINTRPSVTPYYLTTQSSPQLPLPSQQPPVLSSHSALPQRPYNSLPSSSTNNYISNNNNNTFHRQSYQSSQSEPSLEPSLEQPTTQQQPVRSFGEGIRQARRYKTTRKTVQIRHGRLVLECPVPNQYLNTVPLRDTKEFSVMRYSAITCDPSEFANRKYTLRQKIMNRMTEIVVCITMYNEDDILLSRTLYGVMKNIAQLSKRYRSPVWDEYGWQKVVVCIVADGREKINQRVLNMLSVLGVYQEGIAKSKVNDKPVHAHLYEYTTQIAITPDLEFRHAGDGIMPTQIIFCLKEKNQRKINSHRWFFQAICPILQPNICILMDVGTRPGPRSLYNLWLPFNRYANIGGACGEVRVMTGRGGRYLINPLVASQNFEYKISNILDKPLESVLGYIQVLPGAFSAYRYSAIQNDVLGEGPLRKYFLGDTSNTSQRGEDEGIFEANMYLAEDRILCYELVAKRNSSWRLYYVAKAYGETDVPFTIAEFITQRRRWLNGSFFAGVYSLVHWGKILKTHHTFKRKMLLLIELVYLCFNWLFSWFALANFFLSFYILTKSLSTMQEPPFSSSAANAVHITLTYIYAMLLICLFLVAMGNRPQGSQESYGLIMLFFAVLMMYVMFASVWIVYIGVKTDIQQAGSGKIELLKNGPFRDILISASSTFGVFILSSIIFLDPWHMITSFVQFFLLAPSYVNILNTFAFCNTHDVSWGTKDITELVPFLGHVETKLDKITAEVVVPESKDVGYLYEESMHALKNKPKGSKKPTDPKTRQEDYYRNFRTRLVVCWIFTNLVLVIVICWMDNLGRIGNFDTRSNVYLSFILWSVAGLSFFRFLGSTFYRIMSFF